MQSPQQPEFEVIPADQVRPMNDHIAARQRNQRIIQAVLELEGNDVLRIPINPKTEHLESRRQVLSKLARRHGMSLATKAGPGCLYLRRSDGWPQTEGDA